MDACGRTRVSLVTPETVRTVVCCPDSAAAAADLFRDWSMTFLLTSCLALARRPDD